MDIGHYILQDPIMNASGYRKEVVIESNFQGDQVPLGKYEKSQELWPGFIVHNMARNMDRDVFLVSGVKEK